MRESFQESEMKEEEVNFEVLTFRNLKSIRSECETLHSEEDDNATLIQMRAEHNRVERGKIQKQRESR